MSAEQEHQRVGQVFGRRVQEARLRRGWRQEDLANRLKELGYNVERTTVTKIEKGGVRAERAQLWEVLAFAAALGVAPVHLIVPLEDEAALEVTPTQILPAPFARAWIRGQALLPDADFSAYFAEIPESEQRRLLEGLHTRNLPYGQLGRSLIADRIAADVEQHRRLLLAPEEDRKAVLDWIQANPDADAEALDQMVMALLNKEEKDA